jgi:hypothetical protein
MYVRDASGNFMPRIIDFGFSCINYKGLRISIGENAVQFRYCNLFGRDMTQFLYEIVHYRQWLPASFDELADALLTFKRGKKVYRLLANTNIRSWGETYYFMNSSQENINCSPIIFENVLLAYKNGENWRNYLAYDPSVFKKTTPAKKLKKPIKAVKAVKPVNPLDCPADKPDYNPKTKRCVKVCGPDKERNKDFKCVKKTVKAVIKACPADKPDYNPNTKRCVKACGPDKVRDAAFKCVKKATTPKAKVCPPEKPDYNPKTKRCVKACPSDKKRNALTFKCK